MPGARRLAVGPEEPVPPGEVEAEVGVGLVGLHRVVDPVHVRGDEDPAQPPVQPIGQADVAVVEHGHAVQDDLEEDHRHHRRPQDQDGGELDQHGQHDLEGVEARPGGQVVVQVRVVDPMQPPQGRHRMDHDVLEPDGQVHGDHRQRHRHPEGDGKVVEQPPPLGRGGRRQPHGRDREEQAQQDGVEHHQPQVAAPAQGLGDGQGPPRGAQLPQGHEGEDAEEGAEADGRLVGLDEAVQGGSASGRGSGCWGAVSQYWQIRGSHSTDALNVVRRPCDASPKTSVVGAGRARAVPADQCLKVREPGAGGERRGLGAHPGLSHRPDGRPRGAGPRRRGSGRGTGPGGETRRGHPGTRRRPASRARSARTPWVMAHSRAGVGGGGEELVADVSQGIEETAVGVVDEEEWACGVARRSRWRAASGGPRRSPLVQRVGR